MFRFFSLLFFIALSTGAFGQGVSVYGQVVDIMDGTPLIGSYVVLNQGAESTSYQTITDYDGNFILTGVTAGRYTLLVTYLGYANYTLDFTVANESIEVGALKLSQGVELAQIEVVEKVVPIRQRGDTTQLNAAAYKTLPDASAEELVQKMPTIAIADGKLSAQGEEVRRVIVDGKPFFGDDALATLRNLPAKIIESIEIFDEQSEEAKASGFDDGNAAKTINIVTKKNMRNGTFGRLYAGYGSDDRYDAGGNVSNFQGARRLSIVLMTNNVNRQNFSNDAMGTDPTENGNNSGTSGNFAVRPQNGIVSTNALGANLSEEWGERIKVSASYFVNAAKGIVSRTRNRQYFDEEGLTERYREKGDERSKTSNHRFDGRFDYRINDRNTFLWRPKLSWRGNTGEEVTRGTTLLDTQAIDSSRNEFNGRFTSLNVTNNLLWRHHFPTSRRKLTINLYHAYQPNQGDNQLRYAESGSGGSQRNIDQRSRQERDRNYGSLNIQLAQPVSRHASLLVSGRTSVRDESSEQVTYERDPLTDAYDISLAEQSGTLSSKYFSQDFGGGLNVYKGGLRLTARAVVQYASLVNNQLIPPLPPNESTFWSVLPTLSLKFKNDHAGYLSLVYRSQPRLPSAAQLQEVIDNDNPRLLRAGNPGLRQEIRHNLYFRYNSTKASAGTVFFAMLGGGITAQDISNSTYVANSDVGRAYAVPEGSRIILPVNLNGSWHLRARSTLGFPVDLIGSNVNLDLSASTGSLPGLINGKLNSTKRSNTGVGITFSSNVSDRVDFSLSAEGSMNWSVNELQPASNNQFFNQTSRFKLNWIVGPGIVFRNDILHRFYRGLDAGEDMDYVLWNMSIGKQLLKNNRGELNLSVFDLLGQNVSLRRRVTSNFTEDIRTDVLTRYIKLNFKYELRKFGP
ncbi:hypothetical protein GGR28_000612 [Lewinella aquimaris]|uniref:Outer membrane protein beta-barrel domain-containing protein n=1 Tax=Neolewinella aquimaris TaxID=1835722 RepID=A0A840DYF9_9BACT|nr:outer membrane beta-barrel protein [Neolewinella aquimaris]MBB4078011.1 hypothetical protein [Neolewinella aquimaris]